MPATSSGADGDERPLRRLQTCHIDDLLACAIRVGASDLHVSVGLPPVLRVDGKLFQAPFEIVTSEMSERLVNGILTDQQSQEFASRNEIEFTYSARRISEFQTRVFRDKGTVAAAFHTIKQA